MKLLQLYITKSFSRCKYWIFTINSKLNKKMFIIKTENRLKTLQDVQLSLDIHLGGYYVAL